MLMLKTWRDLLARKGQFFGLVFLVVLGISTFVAFRAAYYDLRASIDTATRELKFADFTVKVLEGPEGEARDIARVPGVRAVEARFIGDTGLDVGENEQATARVIGVPPDHRPTVNDLLVLQGHYLSPTGRDEALLHAKFATEAGVKVGDTLTLRFGDERRSLRIVGIVASAEYMYAIREKGDLPSPREFAVLWVHQREAQDLFGKPGAATDYAVRVKPGADVERVIDGVEDVLEPFRIVETAEREDQASYFALQEELEQNRVMSAFMPALILVISSSSLLIALSRLVQSQRGEIGLAKALGYSDTQVLLHYLLYGLVIAALGSLLGILLGDLMARGIAGQYVDLLGVPYLTHHLYADVVLGAVALSAFACLVAALAPAWRSSRLAPAAAMHADPNLTVTSAHIPLVERVLSPVLPRTFTFRIPLRNVSRARRRAIFTVLGIAFALVLTVATVAMFDSIDLLFEKVFGFTERWDVMAVYEQEFGAGRLATIRRWEGVERVQPAFLLPVEIKTAEGTHEGVVTAMEPTADFHGFEIAAGAQAPEALGSGGIIVAEPVARKLGVGPGDPVSVKTPYRDDRTQLKVAAVSRETLGAPLFVSLATARELMGTASTSYNAVYVEADPRFSERIKDELYDLPAAISVNVKSGMVSRLRELMEFASFYQVILLGFGFAMAFVVIYNTFTANVLERTREIATMRTIGESHARLAVMVTIENLMLAAVGIPLGIWLGLRAADAMFASFSSEAYTMTAVIKPLSILWVTLAVIVVLLLSEIPPVRRIFKMDLAEATKVME